MEKVFASASNIQEIESKVLSGLKGEIVSFQIAYYWDGERKAFGHYDIISPVKDFVHVREVKLVPCEYPCHTKRDDGYLTDVPGVYPDLLTDIGEFGFPLISGQWRALWVDVEVEPDMTPGIYPVKIQLKTKEELLCEVDVEMEVLNAVLPKLSVPHTEWFHSDCLANYYNVEVFSEEYWTIVEEFVKTAVKYKCNMLLTPVFTPPLDTGIGGERRTVQLVDVTVNADGSYSFEFSKFHRWVKMALRCGIEYIEISHLFSQWGAVAAPKVMAIKDGVYQRIFGWETTAAGPEYSNFLHQFLTALKKELEVLGIQKQTYFHVSDEPNMEQLESYRAALNVVKEDLKGYTIMDALSNYEFYQQGLVKQPICGLDHIQPFLAEENRPEKLWGYYCTAQPLNVSNRFIVLPGFRTRVLGTQMYKYRLDGFLHWGYNFYNSECSLFSINPYRCTDAAGAFPSGDPFLVYPGADGKPVGSIRLMLMGEAMTDFCAMKALEELAGRDVVMACIEEDAVVEIETYPQGSAWLLKMRERINQAIKMYIS